MSWNDEVIKQSESAFRQWGRKWKRWAKINGKYNAERGVSQRDFSNAGIGKQLLCVAMGPSFEEQIDAIEEHQDKADIMCVDKAFKYLIGRGIKPTYVVIADASIPFKYIEGLESHTEDVVLFANVCANPRWTRAWRGPLCYYVNKDNIQSEQIFGKLSGVRELIPASSNVGNTCVVIANQVMSYDRIVLSGYDFCWTQNSNYYAFHNSDKRFWMKHMHALGMDGEPLFSSANLRFSARWLSRFIQTMRPGTIFNCSGRGLLDCPDMKIEIALSLWEDRKPTMQELSAFWNGRAKEYRHQWDGDIGKLQQVLDSLKYVAGLSIHYLPHDIEPSPEKYLCTN